METWLKPLLGSAGDGDYGGLQEVPSPLKIWKEMLPVSNTAC